jgi:hypothetical protein
MMFWMFGFSPNDPSHTVYYSDVNASPFDILTGIDQFFDNQTAPLLYFFQVLLLLGLSAAAFRALQQENGQSPAFRQMLPAILYLFLPVAAFAGMFGLWNEGFIYLPAIAAYPLISLWAAVIYFERINPASALVRAFGLMRWGTGLVLGFLIVSLQVLVFMFLDFPVWDWALELFSWLVPQKEGAMQTYVTLATTGAAGLLLYFIFLVSVLCGGLQYFSFREISDATSLSENLKNVGTARRIRGLARE